MTEELKSKELRWRIQLPDRKPILALCSSIFVSQT
jgi:hypothetical protein